MLLFMLCLRIPGADVKDKSRCRDKRVYIKSCNIAKYKKGHVCFFFVCLHMKSIKTKTVKTFPDMKHFDQVLNELLLTWL